MQLQSSFPRSQPPRSTRGRTPADHHPHSTDHQTLKLGQTPAQEPWRLRTTGSVSLSRTSFNRDPRPLPLSRIAVPFPSLLSRPALRSLLGYPPIGASWPAPTRRRCGWRTRPLRPTSLRDRRSLPRLARRRTPAPRLRPS
jgi:hypothetical protein